MDAPRPWGPSAPGGPRASSERSAPLFGRSDVLEEIMRRLQQGRDGAGGMTILFGGRGVGKSTFLRAGVQAARSAGYQVLSGRALPTDLPEPFALVQSILKSVGPDGPAPAPVLPTGGMLPLYFAPVEPVTPIRAVEGGEGTSGPGGTGVDQLLSHLANPAEKAESNRNQLFAQLADFFLLMARSRPVLLALDDLQYADESSAEFLGRLVGQIERVPIAILATSSPIETVPEPVARLLKTLPETPVVAQRTVHPFGEREVGEFARWLQGGREPAHDAVMRWFSQTDGNPLFIEQLVRGRATLAPLEDGEARGPDLDEVLRQSIERLPDSERRILVYAAVLGKEFPFDTLSRAVGGEEERLSEIVDRLVQAGVLREKGGEVYEFVSERARSDVYASVTETRRRILHRKIAQAIEARGTADAPTVYELARQFYLAREDSPAAEYSRMAADLAAQAFAYDTAVVFLERALECGRRVVPRDAPRELRLEIELGRFLGELGDLHRSEETLQMAVLKARETGASTPELALALLGLAQTRYDLTQYASARGMAQEAFDLMQAKQNARGVMAAHRVLGLASWRMGDLGQAEAHQRDELKLAEASGTPTEQAHAMVDLANTLLQGVENVPETIELYGRAEKILARSQNPTAHARVLMNRALLYHNSGQFELGLADLTRAVEAAERSRSRIWIGYCSLNMAQFRAEMHQPTAARASLDRALQVLEKEGDQLFLQQAHMISGMIHEEASQFPRAQAEYDTALKQAHDLGLSAEIAEMEYRLARLDSRRGDADGARRHLKAARDAGIAALHADLMPAVEALARQIEPPDGGSVPS